MDSSSDDEGVFVRRKSTSKKIFDSDDETCDKVENDMTEATEDFKLHLSDDDDGGDDNGASVHAKIVAALDEHEEDSSKNYDRDHGSTSPTMEVEQTDSSIDGKPTASAKTNITHKSANSFGNHETADIMKKLSALADSDSESDAGSDLEAVSKSSTKNKFSSKRTSGSDSDSDLSLHLSDNELKKSELTSEGKKKKPGPERKSKTKAKDAMLEIKSERQRQLRQSSIGLPYHVPKQRSLLDFLNRRKSSSPMPIKGSVEQLAAVWKQIEEREKEVEEFYKSESEQESDQDDDEETQVTQESVLAVEPCNVKPDKVSGPDASDTATAVGECSDKTSNHPPSTSEQTSNHPPSTSEQSEKLITEVRDETLTIEGTSCNSAEKMSTGDKVDGDDIQKEVELDSDRFTEGASDTIAGSSNAACFSEECKEVTTSVSVETPVAATSLSTHDSQDISLHYSETQGTSEKDISGVSNSINKKDCITYDTKLTEDNGTTVADHPDKKEDNKSISLEGESSKVDGIWEELNDEMKNIDHDSESECEEMISEQTVLKISAPGPGPHLSLKGAPNDLIDLDEMTPYQSRTPGVKGLIERFMKHSSTKKKVEAQTVDLSLILSEKDTSGGVVDVKRESLRIVLTSDDKPHSENPMPGARLKMLKSELNRQMRKQKEEEWQKKQEEMKNDEVYRGEKDDCGMLQNDEEEEEEEMTDSEAESEPEINDVREPKRKKKSKSLFVDEEAEVEDDDDGGDVGDDENEDCEDDESDDSGDENSEDKESNKSEEESIKDLDQTQNTVTPLKAAQNKKKGGEDNTERTAGRLHRTMTSVSTDLFASQSSEWRDADNDDDDFIPAGQPNVIARPDEANEKVMLFSPMSLSIPGKTQHFMETDHDVTPTKSQWTLETNPQSGMKKLFGESQNYNTQQKLNELAGLFAEKFHESQDGVAALANLSFTGESESDLMALCSGKFVTQPPHPDELEGDCLRADASPGSQFSSQTPEVEKASQIPTMLAGDSVDFSLKFDGDIKNIEDIDEGSKDATEKFRLEIMSSDEEDCATVTVERKKKNRKLEFSDDEDDNPIISDAEGSNSEQSEVCNDESEVSNNQSTKLFEVFSKPSKEVFYDSDENEIEASDFFEKEAELSDEEDWHGSDDEDEKGLDQLEMNEADKEDIDQDLVREQLVKNHMQKMLDEDRRDVRILQEMLLEDGELHSDTGGRERQFRWKNVDSGGMGDDGHCSDEDHAENEEEEDDVWRKQRHEREMFLKEQREKQQKDAGCVKDDDEDEVLENSELLQLGKAVLFKSRSSSLEMSDTKEPPPSKLMNHNQSLSPEWKRSNMLFTRRGSFLSRGDSVLEKLAKISGLAKKNVLAGAKTSGNFVFSAVSPPKKQNQSEENYDQKSSKRKASVDSPSPAVKKPCLPTPVGKASGLFDHL